MMSATPHAQALMEAHLLRQALDRLAHAAEALVAPGFVYIDFELRATFGSHMAAKQAVSDVRDSLAAVRSILASRVGTNGEGIERYTMAIEQCADGVILMSDPPIDSVNGNGEAAAMYRAALIAMATRGL